MPRGRIDTSRKIVFGDVWPCGKCKGSGFLDPNARKQQCPYCNGSGFIYKSEDNVDPDGNAE